MAKDFSYPFVIFPDKYLQIWKAIPEKIVEPAEPVKPIEPKKPLISESYNSGCFNPTLAIGIIILGIILFFEGLSEHGSAKESIWGILCIISGFVVIAINKSNERDFEKSSKSIIKDFEISLAKFQNDIKEYDNKIKKYLADKENYKADNLFFSSDRYLNEFRQHLKKSFFENMAVPKSSFASPFYSQFDFLFDELKSKFPKYENSIFFSNEKAVIIAGDIKIDISIDIPYDFDTGIPTESVDYEKKNGSSYSRRIEIVFAEEQVYLYLQYCLSFIDFVVVLLQKDNMIENDTFKKTKIYPWTRDIAYNMAYLKFRDTYRSKKINGDYLALRDKYNNLYLATVANNTNDNNLYESLDDLPF